MTIYGCGQIITDMNCSTKFWHTLANPLNKVLARLNPVQTAAALTM